MSDARSQDAGDDAIRLHADLIDELQSLSRRLKRTPREVLNEAVREYIARHADPTLGTDKPIPPPKGG